MTFTSIGHAYRIRDAPSLIPYTMTVKVAVECETRGEVLMDFDKSDEDTECAPGEHEIGWEGDSQFLHDCEQCGHPEIEHDGVSQGLSPLQHFR